MEESERAILVDCSPVVPSIILAQLLELPYATFMKRRAKAGVRIGLAEGKRITGRFLRERLNLHSLPLSDAQRSKIRILRQRWLYRRKGSLDRLDREYEIVTRFVHLLPTSAVAEILGVTPQRVIRIQKELEIQLARSDRRKIEHGFATADHCPPAPALTILERAKLYAAWQNARGMRNAALVARREKSERSLQTYRERLEARRAQLQSECREIEICPCSGECKQHWPRTAEFFSPSCFALDKLSFRCKVCKAKYHMMFRLGLLTVKRRRGRGRALDDDERDHIVSVLREYADLIPRVLLAGTFRVGPGTIDRLFHEEKIRHSYLQRQKIRWGWYFANPLPATPLLTDPQLSRLFVLTEKWKKLLGHLFSRDKDYAALLQEEAIRLRTAALAQIPTRQLSEKHCPDCGRSYPKTRLFFGVTEHGFRKRCRVCENLRVALRKREKLQKRFG